MIFVCGHYLEIGQYDRKLINGKQVFRVIKIFKDLTWEALYAGNAVKSRDFKVLPNVISNLQELSTIIKSIESCKVCIGVPNKAYDILPNTSNDVQENVVKVDQDGNENLISRRRSAECTYLLGIVVFSSICESCKKLRKNLSVQLVRLNHQRQQPRIIDSSSRINHRFLTNEERLMKENDQKRRRINAEKRAKYWKFKAVEEKRMKQMDKSDDDDLRIMFDEADKNMQNDEPMFKDNPKMSMFWEMQREAIAKEDKQTAIRWHPL